MTGGVDIISSRDLTINCDGDYLTVKFQTQTLLKKNGKNMSINKFKLFKIFELVNKQIISRKISVCHRLISN